MNKERLKQIARKLVGPEARKKYRVAMGLFAIALGACSTGDVKVTPGTDQSSLETAAATCPANELVRYSNAQGSSIFMVSENCIEQELEQANKKTNKTDQEQRELGGWLAMKNLVLETEGQSPFGEACNVAVVSVVPSNGPQLFDTFCAGESPFLVNRKVFQPDGSETNLRVNAPLVESVLGDGSKVTSYPVDGKLQPWVKSSPSGEDRLIYPDGSETDFNLKELISGVFRGVGVAKAAELPATATPSVTPEVKTAIPVNTATATEMPTATPTEAPTEVPEGVSNLYDVNLPGVNWESLDDTQLKQVAVDRIKLNAADYGIPGVESLTPDQVVHMGEGRILPYVDQNDIPRVIFNPDNNKIEFVSVCKSVDPLTKIELRVWEKTGDSFRREFGVRREFNPERCEAVASTYLDVVVPMNSEIYNHWKEFQAETQVKRPATMFAQLKDRSYAEVGTIIENAHKRFTQDMDTLRSGAVSEWGMQFGAGGKLVLDKNVFEEGIDIFYNFQSGDAHPGSSDSHGGLYMDLGLLDFRESRPNQYLLDIPLDKQAIDIITSQHVGGYEAVFAQGITPGAFLDFLRYYPPTSPTSTELGVGTGTYIVEQMCGQQVVNSMWSELDALGQTEFRDLHSIPTSGMGIDIHSNCVGANVQVAMP